MTRRGCQVECSCIFVLPAVQVKEARKESPLEEFKLGF